MNQIGYKLEKAGICPLFLCPDRLKTGKNSSRLYVRFWEKESKMRYFGGVFPVFSRFVVFRLKQIGKSFCSKRKIILMRLENQSVPNGVFGGLQSDFYLLFSLFA